MNRNIVIVILAVTFLSLVAVSAAYSSPPPRTAIPNAAIVTLHDQHGDVCFRGTRAELRNALRDGTIASQCSGRHARFSGRLRDLNWVKRMMLRNCVPNNDAPNPLRNWICPQPAPTP